MRQFLDLIDVRNGGSNLCWWFFSQFVSSGYIRKQTKVTHTDTHRHTDIDGRQLWEIWAANVSKSPRRQRGRWCGTVCRGNRSNLDMGYRSTWVTVILRLSTVAITSVGLLIQRSVSGADQGREAATFQLVKNSTFDVIYTEEAFSLPAAKLPNSTLLRVPPFLSMIETSRQCCKPLSSACAPHN